MSNAFMAQLPYIGTTSTLGWHNDVLAQSYMDHIVQRARVLLPRRGWRVGVLKEFYPRGASLLGLNVNAGSEVCVRFRVPGKRNEFLPFHEVLCTALHELTHCVHSRHDRAFWNLYYDLVKECEALEVTMIAQGKQLYPAAAYVASDTAMRGSSPSSSPRRAKTSRRGGGGIGGHRLGGEQHSAGRGRGRGAGTTTRSRNGTVTTTARQGKTKKFASASPTGQDGKSSAAFPGEGRRLGESAALRPFDSAPGFTPTRDVLRRILAAAAERRSKQTGSAEAPNPSVRSSSMGIRDSSPSPGDTEADSREAVSDEDDVPDRVPPSQSALDDNDGSWKCSRCGFCNEAGACGCQFCDNDDDDAASLLDEDEVGEPPTKKVRDTAATEEASEKPYLTASLPLVRLGTSRDTAVEISGDEDD
ncbi:hypothetical protein ABB37_01180 [Leptomonas pyrrhocoris]|uniref:WLM domain-containing protein n=1 Tax=Leptomonas pyrrhocoris TaxID=157538 RepID=A0A0M9G8J2_LEPPY|nr:hypothetical protein ABB37_01180 [Leptomonas pyrrhocoris]KPA84669.1 hypothetical protein ABB37_01180 [Leptomonas pyrrhocoris]|eukprot:XP_015663108.1 hypothetical protein ABB37_01180 [Leptomonas pyrrhocoris]